MRSIGLESPDDAQWRALTARERSADGVFWYGVATTGVFCRPSCPSRTPRRANVRVFADPTAARAAGFRPCLRCRPEEPAARDPHLERVRDACRAIESAEEATRLDELAATVGLSPHHFHRVFKRVTGLTPKAYAKAVRERRVRSGLAASRSVTEALYDAGYGSSATFYADAPATLGMKPSARRAGGSGERLRYALGDSSLGRVLVATSAHGICSVTLGDDTAELVAALGREFPRAELLGADDELRQTVADVVALIEAPETGHTLPLDIRGTAFQKRVWDELRRIPVGETASYSEVAARLGAPGSVRAVAGACAANPLAVAVPCHRVVRKGGALAGYRWGVERKRELLAREGAAGGTAPADAP